MKVKTNSPPKKKVLQKFSTMDLILAVICILLVIFTAKMIAVFEETGAIPETLCTCVFTMLGGECGIMGWIKTTKEKIRDREWILKDRKAEQTS